MPAKISRYCYEHHFDVPRGLSSSKTRNTCGYWDFGNGRAEEHRRAGFQGRGVPKMVCVAAPLGCVSVHPIGVGFRTG